MYEASLLEVALRGIDVRTAVLIAVLLTLSASASSADQHSQRHLSPVVDYHQHLFSPEIARLISPGAPAPPILPITASDLVSRLDEAQITRAVVLSVAYMPGQPGRNLENEYEMVKAENDWTSKEVAKFPGRLVGFCGVNPLKEYALQEIARCAADPNLRRGLKLHLGNSIFNYHDASEVSQLRRVFEAANSHRMAITVHMRASISKKMPYGREEARVFLEQILPAAPDVVVQIAHLAGAGGYADPLADDALMVFIDAIRKGDRRTKLLWFDVTGVAGLAVPGDRPELAAERIRQIGIRRVVYGSDATAGSNPSPRDGWRAFTALPLTEREFRTIAANEPPYIR